MITRRELLASFVLAPFVSRVNLEVAASEIALETTVAWDQVVLAQVSNTYVLLKSTGVLQLGDLLCTTADGYVKAASDLDHVIGFVVGVGAQSPK